jgi:hypothetical protein
VYLEATIYPRILSAVRHPPTTLEKSCNMFMKELQWDLEEKEQMDILLIPFLSEMGNPCISVLHMGKCATQFTL